MTKKKFTETYLTDNPIDKKSNDRFDRWSFAERIAQTIGQREDSGGLVIGLYGEWGDGKTSTLNLMEHALKGYGDIVVTRFNPWYFQSEATLIEGFFNHLAETIDKSIPTAGEKVVGYVKKYGGILAAVAGSVTFAGVGLNVNPGAVHSAASDAAKGLGLEELHKRIETILAKSEKRIVVLIDDIDRLDKDEIQQIFKLVRLSGSFQKVTYVLAFDEKMVAAALRDKYTAGDGDSGLKFIEKIVQVPLHLPPAHTETLRTGVFNEIDKTLKLTGIELTERDASAIAYEFQTSLSYALRTPRQVKRYANAIMFAVPALRGEACVADQLLIEAIRIFYPNIYMLIRENPEDFLGGGYLLTSRDKRKAAIMETALKDTEGDEHKRVLQHLLEKLFPRVGGSTYGDEWEKTWAEEKRICSRAYFRRYFNYGIPKGDISDIVFSEFISIIDKETNKRGVINCVTKFIKVHGSHAFIEKLSLIERSLGVDVVKKIALGVASNGALFKDNGDMFSDFSRSAFFIGRTLLRIPQASTRDVFATEVLSVARPVAFAVETFLVFSREDKTPEANQSITALAQQKLGKELADRIRVESTKSPPYAQKRAGARLLWYWGHYGAEKEAGTYVTKRLQKKPGEVADFLSAFVGTSYGSEGARRSDLRGNEYNSVLELVAPGDIMKAIKKSSFGKHVDANNIYFDRGLSDDQRIVNQFVHIFNARKVTVENSVTAIDNP